MVKLIVHAFWMSNVLVTPKTTETDRVYITTHNTDMDTFFPGNGLVRDKQ